MNPWRRGSPTQNPYAWTAFRVCRVPRETVRHQIVVSLIGRTRRLIAADEQHAVCGRAVSSADLNVAEQILLEPEQRLTEELLEHAAERPPLDRLRRLAVEAAARMGPEGAPASAGADLAALEGWAAALISQLMAASPGPDPSLGAFETRLPPPFGDSSED